MAGPSITSVVQAGAIIASTINQISDVNKRRQMQGALSLLNDQEQIALAQSIANQNNANAQTQILINVLLTAQSSAADRQARTQTVLWIILAAVGVTVIGIIAWKMKK